MALTIDMTLPGVLEAGKWATDAELVPGADKPDYWRNRLIWVLSENTDKAFYVRAQRDLVRELQALQNEVLIGMGAVLIFLRELGAHDRKVIDGSTHDQRRGLLIEQIGPRTGRTSSELEQMSNQRLVDIGLQWFSPATTDPTFGDPDNPDVDPTVFGYFQMMLERARTHYLASDVQRAQQLLDWINLVFPAVALNSKNRERIQPLVDSVTGLRKQLQNRLDYFGFTAQHVPVCSVEYYRLRTEKLLSALLPIQKTYYDYLSASRADRERHSDYAAALGQASALCDTLDQDRNTTLSMIKGTVSDIRAKENEVEAKRQQFLEKTRGLDKEISDAFTVPSADQLASVLLNLSFMPEKEFAKTAMVASQAVTAGSETVHALSKVRMDDGTEIDKSLAINRFDTLGSDIASLGAGYTVSRHYIEKDAGVYRILQKAEQFEEFCRKFYESSPGARDAQAAVESYVGAIKYRNAKIDEYNALWARLVELDGQLAKVTADRDEKALALARSEQPGVAHRVAAFDNLYNRVRDSAVRSLYSMARAYSFWALKPYDDFAKLCGLSDPDAIDHAQLSTALTKIEEHCTREIEGVRSELRMAAMPDAKANLMVATGVYVTLTPQSHPEFISALRSTGVARFEVPPRHPSFGGKANVRVTRVRAWIDGLKPEGEVHEVLITHCGPETIVTTDGKPVTFQHDRVSVPFRYDSSKGLLNPRAIFEGQGGCHDGVILEGNYAPIGAFTHWRLAILKDNNPDGLDVTGISKVVMEFHFDAQSLAKNVNDG